MKRNKKLCVLYVLMMCMMIFVGCGGPKETIAVETFVSQLEQAGLTVTNQSADIVEGSGIVEVQVALLEDKYQIEFYQMDSEGSAQYFYTAAKSELEDAYGDANGNVKTSVSAANYAKYTLSLDGRYYIVSRIGDTLVYAIATSDNKDTVKDLVETLGY